MSARNIPEALVANQHKASDPAHSAWVSANAGSGKTHVLTQRVIRLLLDGTPPQKILCLTFTKAAAANMATRVFDTLAKWTALDDDALDKAIRDTGAKATGPDERARARRLFATALETPGGLKVQTIHAFCTRLLQQFPFEAGVPARFSVMEETEQRQLVEQMRLAALLEASAVPESDTGKALAALITSVSDQPFRVALDEAIRKRGPIARWIENAGGIGKAVEDIARMLNITSDDTAERLEAEFFAHSLIPEAEWPTLIETLAQGNKTDVDHIARLEVARAAQGREKIEAYLQVFCTTELSPRKNVVTGKIGKAHPDWLERLEAEKVRVCKLLDRERAVRTRDRTQALLTLSTAIVERYRAEKSRRALLDFDDLIGKTRALLANVESAWVHYKIDLGIDHVLIDEAQDTSPEQWEIVERLVADFFSGAGARGPLKRSLFVVGDDKQSIFSFQGAAPDAFDEKRRAFAKAHKEAGLEMPDVPLHHSFRSAPLILKAVDTVFELPHAHKGLSNPPAKTHHDVVRDAAPGLVELWPLVEPDEKPKVEPWDAPFDRTSETTPRVKLARRIAAAVKAWIDRGETIEEKGARRAMRYSDVLVLVRQRGQLFDAIIRALKNAGLPVAGADRLTLTDHIAVMDLMALGDALLLPDDELALATVLKSPLFGLDEEGLFKLAYDRKGPLRAALRDKQPAMSARFDALADAARSLSPFAFYADVLGARGGRKQILARLGPEANDAIDEFLNLALAYEARETPSLQGFLAWLRSASAEVKRDMEMARDEVRVMTTHGAKGLEAPVVILADTTTMPRGPAQYQPRLLALPVEGGVPGAPDRLVWMTTKKEDTGPVVAARERIIAQAEDEHRRLLYVALTRAADRLIVCGSIGEQKPSEGCWYELVKTGLEATNDLTEEPADYGDGSVWRYRKEQTPPPMKRTDAAPKSDALPAWLERDVTKDAPGPRLVSPSDDEEGDIIISSGGAGADHARKRGVIIHRLLQSLPEIATGQRERAARDYLTRAGRDFDNGILDEIATQVLALLDDARFAPLFAPGSCAEVPIIGTLAKGDIKVSGQVDRLAIMANEILIVDYKSHRAPPRETPAAYVRQLALYRAVLKLLYPQHKIRAAIVWTTSPQLVEVPEDALDAALRQEPDAHINRA